MSKFLVVWFDFGDFINPIIVGKIKDENPIYFIKDHLTKKELFETNATRYSIVNFNEFIDVEYSFKLTSKHKKIILTPKIVDFDEINYENEDFELDKENTIIIDRNVNSAIYRTFPIFNEYRNYIYSSKEAYEKDIEEQTAIINKLTHDEYLQLHSLYQIVLNNKTNITLGSDKQSCEKLKDYIINYKLYFYTLLRNYCYGGFYKPINLFID